MQFLDKNTIKLDREMSDLDNFVFDFISILKKHAFYVIISGYVSILLGRSRSTEDIDVFIKEIDFKAFENFYDELKKNNFWCLNSGNIKEIYEYLKDRLAIRFALADQTIPNFEVKFAIKPLDLQSFEDRVTVRTSAGNLFISSLERQIAFKRYYLKSDKDLEDALHIEKTFKENLDKHKILKYKQLIERS